MSKDINCTDTEEVVCPYCGYEFEDSWEFVDEEITECGECGKEFIISEYVDVTYSTSKLYNCTSCNKNISYKEDIECSKCRTNKGFEKFLKDMEESEETETMNIHAQPGTKIKVTEKTAQNGYEGDKEKVQKYLSIGKTYTVGYTQVYGWCTDVYLQELPGKAFNSVNFTEEESIEDDGNR